jgi:hypothetical protein
MLARFPADEYPHLAEFTFGPVLQPGYDYGDEYEFGLGLILDGLERAHRTAQSPNRTAGDKSRTDSPAGTSCWRFRPASIRSCTPIPRSFLSSEKILRTRTG